MAVILELLFRLSSGAAALFLLWLLEGNKLYMKEERNLLKTDVGAEVFGSSYSVLFMMSDMLLTTLTYLLMLLVRSLL